MNDDQRIEQRSHRSESPRPSGVFMGRGAQGRVGAERADNPPQQGVKAVRRATDRCDYQY